MIESISLREYFEALRQSDETLSDERDRRYSEVAAARAEALSIKEDKDKEALRLAREIQTYKDEKANELRSQIESERGTYATQGDLRAALEKMEATIKPLAEFMSSQQGRRDGVSLSAGVIVGAVTAIGAVVGIIVVIANVLSGGL